MQRLVHAFVIFLGYFSSLFREGVLLSVMEGMSVDKFLPENYRGKRDYESRLRSSAIKFAIALKRVCRRQINQNIESKDWAYISTDSLDMEGHIRGEAVKVTYEILNILLDEDERERESLKNLDKRKSRSLPSLNL